jgi:hypothetical protein
MKLKRNAAKCLKCGDIVESFTVHDFKMCSCESMFVDGGLDYMRRGGDPSAIEDLSEPDSGKTVSELTHNDIVGMIRDTE